MKDLSQHLEDVARTDERRNVHSKHRESRARAFYLSTISPKAQLKRRKRRKGARKARRKNRGR